ncbi:MAG TPA: PQQ-binding-like beta-propeller repeat protein [Polyangiaceae bacterium]|nr:PQQ-binding-like beta-propeller repeat protein [Polyangiaceae bacterium]
MTKLNRQPIVVASVVALVFLSLAVLKHRAATRPIPQARQALPVGSWIVAPAISSTPNRPLDPKALVVAGPPTMFHLDPAHRNRSPFVGPASPSLSVLADLHAPIQTAPAVLPNGTIVVETLDGHLFGLREDGTVVFKTPLEDRLYASPLVWKDRLFIGTDDDRFVSLSSTGNVLWSLATDGDADTSASPTPDHGLVFAANETLFFARMDGTVVWRVRAKRKIYSSPAVDSDGSVYVGAQDQRVYGIRRTGVVRFATRLEQQVDCAPSIGEYGLLYVGTDGGAVVALDTQTGQVRWKTTVQGHVRGGLTVTRSHDVVAGVYGPSPRVVAMRGDTGEQLWSFSIPGTGAKEYGIHGSPVEDAQGNLYFGAQDDAVYSLTARGAFRWKAMTAGDVDAPVVIVSDGVLLAGSDDGKLYRITEQ